MKWMDKFAESINRFAGEIVRKEAMDGSKKTRSSSTPNENAKWIKDAMEGLDALVDEETKKNTMIGTLSHMYPKGRIQKLRRQYRQLSDIGKLLEIVHYDHSWKRRGDYQCNHAIYLPLDLGQNDR